MKDSRWLQRVEMVAAISVVITLVLLVIEVRGNTRALERQILLDRASTVAVPFMEGDQLLEAYDRVKTVDGWGPQNREFMERYGMEPQQAVAWSFFLYKIWTGLEADFLYSGPSKDLAAEIRSLLSFPDNQVYWRHSAGGLDAEFIAYAVRVTGVVPPADAAAGD